MAVLVTLGLAACSEGPTDSVSFAGRPQATQVVEPGFTFLPPLVKQAVPEGTFNPDLSPVLEICQVVGGECSVAVARLELTGDVQTGIAAAADSSQYMAHWRFPTTGSPGVPVLPSGNYRFSVFASPAAGALRLGYVDAVYTADGRVTYPDGQSISESGNMPIKFFIPRGILCATRASDNPGGEPCLEVAVGPAGGTFTVDTKLAGAYFPAGALSETVTLIIERYEPPATAGGPASEYACLPVYHPQYTGCYVFNTEPKVTAFNSEVVVGICPDASALPLEQELELWKWDEVDESSVLELPRRDVTFLECPGWSGLAAAPASTNGSLAWARAIVSPVAQFFLPRPLHARGISPFGGGLNDFSRIGWVRPLALEKVSGDAQTGYAGQLLPEDLTVRVVANGEKVAGLGIPVAGVPLTFSPSSGSAAPSSAVTNASGLATTSWTLGTDGPSTLTVNGANPYSGFPNVSGTWSVPPHGAPAVFTANGVLLPPPPELSRYRVAFTSPIQKGRIGDRDVNVPGVPVTVRVCSVATTQCWPTRRLVDNNGYHFQWKSDASYPTGNYTFTVLEGTTVVDSFVGAVSKDGTKYSKDVAFTFQLGGNVPIKFWLIAR